jgi:hypothetical protein
MLGKQLTVELSEVLLIGHTCLSLSLMGPALFRPDALFPLPGVASRASLSSRHALGASVMGVVAGLVPDHVTEGHVTIATPQEAGRVKPFAIRPVGGAVPG